MFNMCLSEHFSQLLFFLLFLIFLLFQSSSGIEIQLSIKKLFSKKANINVIEHIERVV